MIILYILAALYILLFVLELFFSKPGASFDIYFGVPGAGKTTIAAWITKKQLKKKRSVHSNVAIKGAYAVDKEDIGRYLIENTTLIIDEAGVDYNNRNYKKFTDEEVYFYKFHRHYNCNIALFSQDFEDMDKKLRKLARRYFYIRKSFIPFFVSRRMIQKKIGIDKETHQIVEQYYFVPFSRKLIFAPQTWKMFDSYTRKDLPVKKFKIYGDDD